MPAYRITKYDPSFRDASGRYTRSEWTAVSDVGRTFDGKVFEREEYLRVEGAYVSAVRSMMSALGVSELEVRDLELRDGLNSEAERVSADGLGQIVSLSEHCIVRGPEVDFVVRRALRELIWCRLVGANGFYVHFGYDYYLYAGWSDRSLEVIPTFAGLFVESFPSPYFDDAAE